MVVLYERVDRKTARLAEFTLVLGFLHLFENLKASLINRSTKELKGNIVPSTSSS